MPESFLFVVAALLVTYQLLSWFLVISPAFKVFYVILSIFVIALLLI